MCAKVAALHQQAERSRAGYMALARAYDPGHANPFSQSETIKLVLQAPPRRSAFTLYNSPRPGAAALAPSQPCPSRLPLNRAGSGVYY